MSHPDFDSWSGDIPDPHPEGRREIPEPPQMCQRCNGDVVYPVTSPAFGVFCSHACLDLAEADFSEWMQRRGFQQVGVKK